MEAQDNEVERAPPAIALENENQASDLAFHTSRDAIAVGMVDGSVKVYHYSLQGNTCVLELNHHKDSCRTTTISSDGAYLFTGSADKSLAVVDLAAGKVLFQKQNAHNNPLLCAATHEHLLATGDEEGGVKLWDLRQSKELFSWEENEDFISELLLCPENNAILASSGDGSLSVFHLKRGTLTARTEPLEDELLSVAVLKEGKRVVCGTQEGILYSWSWGEWEEYIDRFPGHPQSIDAMLFVDQDTICTGSSDGLIRIVSIAPNNMLGIIGEHGEMPIECLRQSYDRRFMATASHDSVIKFWDVAYLYAEDDDDDAEVTASAVLQKPDSMETEKTTERKPSNRSFYSGFK